MTLRVCFLYNGTAQFVNKHGLCSMYYMFMHQFPRRYYVGMLKVNSLKRCTSTIEIEIVLNSITKPYTISNMELYEGRPQDILCETQFITNYKVVGVPV